DVHIQNYINGEWAPPTNGLFLDKYNPATGQVILQIPDSASADVDNAVKAVKAAFPLWSKTPVSERAAILLRIADLIDENSSILGTFESLDQGKPVFSAIHFEMPMCAASFRQFAKLITDGGIKESESRLESMITPTSITQPKASITESVTQHIAAGVAGLITPWNFPLPMVCFKIAPCIAAGSTCVVKPTELSSITSFLLSHILHAAGVPKGVVNIIFGSGLGAGEPLVKHKDVKLISFTGGSATGARIGALASGQFKRVSLELGGKNPAVFFDDCNIDHAVTTGIRGAYKNQGEICLCASRQYVQHGIYEKFVEMFRQKVRSDIFVGNPLDPKTFYGPVISQQHMDKVLGYIRLAQEEGATVEFLVNPSDTAVKGVSSDGRLTIEGHEGGYFIAPTLITNIKQSSRVMQEEIFGPVVCILPFGTEEEAVELANDTDYGLSASVWTLDHGKLDRVMRQINAGLVWGNNWLNIDQDMPFGGMGCSGNCRENGKYSLEFYTEVKTLSRHVFD
ncbi:hypothetical protein LPJ66_010410, partial [Kickxella alabastrina]